MGTGISWRLFRFSTLEQSSKKPKQVLHVERVSQTLRKGESTLFRGKLLVYGESRPEITCIQYDIQRQHTLKQETIKSALEAGV